MNRTVNVLLLVLLMVVGVNLWAQQAAKGKTDGKQPGKSFAGKKLLVPMVFLGRSDYKGGPIKKQEFDDLLKQGLTSKDSVGNKYKVVGFQFSYAERNVYEDSIGNLQAVTDLAYEYCPGDTISAGISGSIYDRTKPGDTLYFDRISVVKYAKNSSQTDAQAISARPMKFFIIK